MFSAPTNNSSTQCSTMVSEVCTCTGSCASTEATNNTSSTSEQKQGEQKQGEQKQGEQKQGEQKQGEQKQDDQQGKQQQQDLETQQNCDFQPDQQQCPLVEPMPSAEPEGQWFTIPPARSRTDTRAQFVACGRASSRAT